MKSKHYLIDTLFADVSEHQVPVDNSYPYPVLSIRASDGTYKDGNFAHNYQWMLSALDSHALTFGIVYTYARPNWQETAETVRSMIDAHGGLHSRVVLMVDVESGGNPRGDGSSWINPLYWNLVDYTGTSTRVIGYSNPHDFQEMWPIRPPDLRVVAALYGADPDLPGQVAHQYTNGKGYSPGLPQGAPPFGNCAMNAASSQLAETVHQ